MSVPMRSLIIIATLVLAASSAWRPASAQQPPASASVPEQNLAWAMQRREAVFGAGLDALRLSEDIALAVREAQALEGEGKNQQALERLQQLHKHMPLAGIPSADVQARASILHGKLGNAAQQREHAARAVALVTTLRERIGSGKTADDPLRVVMPHEAVEWVRAQPGKKADLRVSPMSFGSGMLVLNFKLDDVPVVAYARLDHRLRRPQAPASATVPPAATSVPSAAAPIDRYAPLPLAVLKPELLAAIELARTKRESYLRETAGKQSGLVDKAGKLRAEAIRLDMAGEPAQALAKLREIETLRPAGELPIAWWLTIYSHILGRNGETARQEEMRTLIFGVQQVVAHSGDGRSRASAIHVIAIPEEYDWLTSKKLTRVRQELVSEGGRHYDLMTVKDAAGAQQQVWFDVTAFFGH
jgi:hypothetical protein